MSRKKSRRAPARTQPLKRSWTTVILAWAAASLLIYYVALSLTLAALKWINPPFTSVQIERRFAAWIASTPYRKLYRFVPLEQMSPHLLHAVIAAEDARFYSHHGFDWKEVRASLDKALDGGKPRGASTITQQLVRNLFLSTDPSVIRKGLEFTMVPPAELILGKRRILELYLNVVEWGPGLYGSETAAEYYFYEPATQLTRDQAVELASILPSPLRRKPGTTEWYVARIRTRMREMGW